MRGLLVLASLLAFVLPVDAGHCSRWSTTQPTAEVGAFYLKEDLCRSEDCIGGVWIYQESNGLPGLQRGDDQHDDTCHGQIEPDTIIL